MTCRIDDESKTKILVFDSRNKYDVLIPENIKSNLIGTETICSGKNSAYFYKLIELQKLNFNLLKSNRKTINLKETNLLIYINHLGTEGLEPSRLSLSNGF
jgi:hypothetical protein